VSWRRCLSLAVLCGVLAAGCRSGAGDDPVRAESLKERLANQARAIATLEAENEKLRRQVQELEMEDARLRKEPAKPRAAGGKETRKP